jgi:hypothetical protein
MQMAVAGKTFRRCSEELDQTPNDVPNSAKAAPADICLPGLWLILNVSSERDIDAAFTTFIAQRVSALLVVGAGAVFHQPARSSNGAGGTTEGERIRCSEVELQIAWTQHLN